MDVPAQEQATSLLQAGRKRLAKLCAVFGGQGPNNPSCLDELSQLYDANQSVLARIIELATATISELSSSPDIAHIYEETTFDIKAWLFDQSLAPDKAYLATAPFSFPIITLNSLASYVVVCRKLGILPRDFRDSLSGVTGHSQGIIAAAVVAKSGDWDHFYETAEAALKMSFWIGCESHIASPESSLSAATVRDAEAFGEGRPSVMLSVDGLKPKYIQSIVGDVNEKLPFERHIHLALVNAREKTVISGHPDVLRMLSLRLRKISATEGLDQRRVPFIHRKPVVHQQYLPISGIFHSPHLDVAVAQVLARLNSTSWTGKDLAIPLYHTGSGENIQQIQETNLTERLLRAIMSDMVDWPKVCSSMDMTHCLDFGPGSPSSLVNESLEGTGLKAIRMHRTTGTSTRYDSGIEALLSPFSPDSLSWKDLNGPYLVKMAEDKFQMVGKMSEVFGTPPIMVAGMTPTTVPWDFVAAVMNSGYHIELAGGGYSQPESFEQAIKNIRANIPVGRGITCNVIYANPRQLAWQIPILRRLNQDGVQIDGLTIGAGIPSADVVKEYIDTIGLSHISFKPGSYESILEVVDIARRHPSFPIGLQWTGGRAGGHHSFDDFHTPLLRSYGQIRQCPNIILIAGSGFGGVEDTLPHLTGEWACSFGYPSMPVDGVLLGSRLMVAKEAHTSPEVKELIVKAEGLEDFEWYKTYEGPAGGFITINSEMGEPIHMLATRGTLLWRDLESTIFSIKDSVARLRTLKEHRTNIVQRLNRDYAKPWFAVTSTGECVDIEDLTYFEVISRMIDLMYVPHQRRWIHISYLTLVLDFMERAEERLPAEKHFDYKSHDDPQKLLAEFLRCCPSVSTEVLYPDDVSYLMALFRRRGQKPVNFIPALDEQFETWFKKDSLWQAEDLDAVPGQDIQRICVIHGPVAARHSTIIDEPAGAILDKISQGHFNGLLSRQPRKVLQEHNATTEVSKPGERPELANVLVKEQPMQRTYELAQTGVLPDLEIMIRCILEGSRDWLHACLMDTLIYRGHQLLPNPIRSAFKLKHGDVVIVRYASNDRIQEVSLVRRSPTNFSWVGESLKLISQDSKNVVVKKSVPNPVSSVTASISFNFTFLQSHSKYRLFEDHFQRHEKIKDFYAELWNINLTPTLRAAGLTSQFPGRTVTLTKDVVTDFMDTVSKSDVSPCPRWSPKRYVPLDVCVFVAWTALVTPLLISAIDVDLLKLLHRSNSFEYYPGVRPLEIGDTLNSSSRINAVTIEATGKSIEVAAEITRDHEAVIKVTSTFFIQGRFSDYERTFKSIQDPDMMVFVSSEIVQSLLLSRQWLIFDQLASSLVGKSLLFRTTCHRTYMQGPALDELKVDGRIYLKEEGQDSQYIGRVYFEGEQCEVNPVSGFLDRHGYLRSRRQVLDCPGPNEDSTSTIRIPKRSSAYSRFSRDTNPIHICPIFAGYCHLPGTVTHGMYTSAAVRRAVERAVGDMDCTRFRQYSASFQCMVLPGDILSVTWSHVAMVEGRMVLSIQAYKEQTKEKVLEAEAEIEQISTAYLFCGQGSQEKDMGMSLYETSDTARAIWDRADRYLQEVFGGYQIIEDHRILLTEPQVSLYFTLSGMTRNLSPSILAVSVGGKYDTTISR